MELLKLRQIGIANSIIDVSLFYDNLVTEKAKLFNLQLAIFWK